jgi:hypothetical protein
MGDQVAVRVRDCACPDAPHDGVDGADDGDIVYLRARLNLAGGLAAAGAVMSLMGPDFDQSRVPATLGPIYVRHGAVGWNLLNERGEPVPFDVEVLLNDYLLGFEVWDRADDLYADEVLRPLQARMPRSSPRGRTGVSTSAKRSSARPRPSPSAPS